MREAPVRVGWWVGKVVVALLGLQSNNPLTDLEPDNQPARRIHALDLLGIEGGLEKIRRCLWIGTKKMDVFDSRGHSPNSLLTERVR